MSDQERFTMSVLLGSVVIPRPTGRVIIDRDGWAHAEYTDHVTLDQHGNEVSRRPADPVIKWQSDETINIARLSQA